MLVDLSKSNTFPVVEHEKPWYINGVVIGCYKPASVLKELPGLDKLDDAIFKGKYVRQLGLRQMERQLSLVQTDHGEGDLLSCCLMMYAWPVDWITTRTKSTSRMLRASRTLTARMLM